jgi:hypothetical protein
MMELTQRRSIAYQAPAASANQQSRLVIALVLLLVALAAVLIKDRQFWFGSDSTRCRSGRRREAPQLASAKQHH